MQRVLSPVGCGPEFFSLTQPTCFNGWLRFQGYPIALARGGGDAFIKRVVMERKSLLSFPVLSGLVNAAFLVDGFERAREAVSWKH